MSKTKCIRCGKLAHVTVNKKYYCLKCVPKPTTPVVIEETLVNEALIEKVERPRPWLDPPEDRILSEEEQPVEYFKPLSECIEKKKPWWKRLFGF
jgi:hypothetical protein